VEWLSYTYLFVRMRKNPLNYGITHMELEVRIYAYIYKFNLNHMIRFVLKNDPNLIAYRRRLIKAAAKRLDLYKMLRFNEVTDYFHPTDLGRIASHYYIKSDTIEVCCFFF